MNKTELTQSADFLSIALQCIDSEDDDVAIDFLEDVADDLSDEDQADSLEWAADELRDGNRNTARSSVEQVNAEILQDLESLE